MYILTTMLSIPTSSISYVIALVLEKSNYWPSTLGTPKKDKTVNATARNCQNYCWKKNFVGFMNCMDFMVKKSANEY
ncbi:MAG: hypothetical protein AAF960_29300 [Bacteroidota bacterium]